MNESKISVRYAKALFIAASEAKVLTEVMQDMNLFMTVYSYNDFRAVLDSPIVKTSEKKKVVELLFSKKINDLSMKFIDLMLSNKRESYLPHIARNFKQMFKRSEGIMSAEIVVTKKIDNQQKEKFKELLKKTFKSEILLEETIKPEILGGFILRVEDEQYDASIASELKKIKKQLLESSSVK
jgi:F-type H+-transporting ATPase subunit delta